MEPEDRVLLEAVADYCKTLTDAVHDYSINEEVLKENPAFRGMVAFFVQQVGECAKKVSAGFKDAHPEIEWRAICGFRNRIAHAYGKIDIEMLWDVVRQDIPELHRFCLRELDKEKS